MGQRPVDTRLHSCFCKVIGSVVHFYAHHLVRNHGARVADNSICWTGITIQTQLPTFTQLELDSYSFQFCKLECVDH